MFSSRFVARRPRGAWLFLLLSKPVTSTPCFIGRCTAGILLRDRVMSAFHVRYSVIAASVIALAGLFQFQSSIAAEPLDHRIYSPIPFSFKADRGIFSEVPQERVD